MSKYPEDFLTHSCNFLEIMKLNCAYIKIILFASLELGFLESNDYFVLEACSELKEVIYAIVCHFSINHSCNNNININVWSKI